MRFVVFVIVVVFMAVAASAGSAVKPRTINLLEVSTSFVGTGGLDETFSGPPKAGQGFVIGSDFYRWSGAKRGAHYGTLQAVCTFTKIVGENVWQICTGSLLLPGGDLTVSGVIKQTERFNIPIVGGTGIYAGARGYVHVKGISDDNSADTIVITG